MEKIIRNEYEKGINEDKTKEDKTIKEYIKNENREKIKKALKIAGFSDDGDSLSKYEGFSDTIDLDKKDFLTFRVKNGGYFSTSGCRLGYEVQYFYNSFFGDNITISIHGEPSVTYEFRNIKVPDEIMFALNGVSEKFINFLDEKINTIKNNLDFSNYQKIVEILK